MGEPKDAYLESKGLKIGKDQNVDVIGFRDNGTYDLGEGKGTNVEKAKSQFETVGKALGGPDRVASQNITVTKLPPGYKLNSKGQLMVVDETGK